MQNRLYVGNIDDKVDDLEIFSIFSPFGSITQIITRDRFCFVDYKESKHAKDAKYQLNGTILNNQAISVEFSRTKEKRKEDSQSCRRCGKNGHFFRDCREILELTCFACGKKGHKQMDCKQDNNKRRRQDISSTE